MQTPSCELHAPTRVHPQAQVHAQLGSPPHAIHSAHTSTSFTSKRQAGAQASARLAFGHLVTLAAHLRVCAYTQLDLWAKYLLIGKEIVP